MHEINKVKEIPKVTALSSVDCVTYLLFSFPRISCARIVLTLIPQLLSHLNMNIYYLSRKKYFMLSTKRILQYVTYCASHY